MTKLDIERLAIELGIHQRTPHSGPIEDDDDLHEWGRDGVSLPVLRLFANAVLERAASMCDERSRPPGPSQERGEAMLIAAYIRDMKV